ncbi:MAG: D-2-hydroxyacid dehydrogenase [Crocinitomicaceae bacterium]|nr:D-2-hydroxyacid dehydrogenase [Crocinitomicaceae bacterium]
MKVLANDGISPEGVSKLEEAGFVVSTTFVPQDQLIDVINNEGYEVLLVRSATTVRKDLIDACPNLKFIGRGGVGMDNIDVAYARSIGRIVQNTPAASSQSVAEMVMGNMFAISRSLHDSYKNMPVNGETEFKTLKKKYGKGVELNGKTLLIIGFGRIGQALASYALGVGMKVTAVDMSTATVSIPLTIHGIGTVHAEITPTNDLHAVLGTADYISIHVPKQADGSAVIQKSEFNAMKDGVRIINAARGGVVNEDDLLAALASGKVAAAALDVFENEPTPRKDLLTHEKIACTPHIGAATIEAQDRIGGEMADLIISAFIKA